LCIPQDTVIVIRTPDGSRTHAYFNPSISWFKNCICYDAMQGNLPLNNTLVAEVKPACQTDLSPMLRYMITAC